MMPLYPTDPELDAIYQVGFQLSHYAGLRSVFQAALDAQQNIADPLSASNTILQTAPTQDATDLSTETAPTQ